jgi:hypothetical protein
MVSLPTLKRGQNDPQDDGSVRLRPSSSRIPAVGRGFSWGRRQLPARCGQLHPDHACINPPAPTALPICRAETEAGFPDGSNDVRHMFRLSLFVLITAASRREGRTMSSSTAGVRPTSWPESLSDQEAVQRLRTLCLGACDGVQDLADDGRYKVLRRALLSRADLRPLAPAAVAAEPNLPALVRHLRETKDRGQRREMIRAQFVPLMDEVGASEAVTSSKWTGRVSVREQALFVRALAPTAMMAVERLISDEMRLRDNGGPVDDHREAALSHLRALHAALGELIDLAREERPLEGMLGKLQALRQSAKVTIAKAAATTPVTASALIAFAGVVGITDFFVGNVVVSLAAGSIAGNTVKDAMLKRDGKAQG